MHGSYTDGLAFESRQSYLDQQRSAFIILTKVFIFSIYLFMFENKI